MVEVGGSNPPGPTKTDKTLAIGGAFSFERFRSGVKRRRRFDKIATHRSDLQSPESKLAATPEGVRAREAIASRLPSAWSYQN